MTEEDTTTETPEKLTAFDLIALMAEIKVAAGEADDAEAAVSRAQQAHADATAKAQGFVRKLLEAAVA